VKDERYASGEGEFLVEEELEGEYTKWWVKGWGRVLPEFVGWGV
jgi:hypothetical protein